jgi:hypothetical protein
VTVTVIGRKYSLIKQSSGANHCYCVQMCVLQCSSCLPKHGLLRPQDKIISNLEQSQLSPTNPYPGGITSNCKHSAMCLLALNTRPLTSLTYHLTATKGRARVKTNGRDFGMYGRAAISGPGKVYCSWDATWSPSFSQKPPSKETLQLPSNAWRHQLRSVKPRPI